MNDPTDEFLDRVDVFAAGLPAHEQAMLQALLLDDDEVRGFNFNPPWPGARSLLSPMKIGTITDLTRTGTPTGVIDGRISGTDLGSSRRER